MISQIHLQNYLLAKDIKLDLTNGLQIISGETGAGKSVLIGAIQTVFGASVNKEVLKNKNKAAYLEITFEVNKNKDLEQLINKYELDVIDNEIFFIREILPNSRTKSFINGRRVTISIMQEFQQVLIDYHNQRDHLKLLDTKYQLQLIDDFGGLENIRSDYSQHYMILQNMCKNYEKLVLKEKQNKEKQQLYLFQIEELTKAELKENEDKDLEKELHLLEHAEDIINLFNDFNHHIIEKEDSVYDQVNLSLTKLTRFAENDERIQKAIEFFYESLHNLENAIEYLRDTQQSIDLDEERLEQTQYRLSFLNGLSQKYQLPISEIIEYKKEIEQKNTQFSSLKEQIKELKKQINSQKRIVFEKSEFLTDKRKKNAKRIVDEIKKNLSKMAIPHANVEIQFDNFVTKENFYDSLSGLKNSGNDTVEIYFSANLGMPLQTLQKAASGGELSRFLLTIKKIISDKVDPKIVIFDEIDAGIGGKTAEYVGEFIHDIGRNQQVICITHLAQVASFANRHFSIEKISSTNETNIIVNQLSDNKRHHEIARMIAGENTENALNYAKELIKNKDCKENKKR